MKNIRNNLPPRGDMSTIEYAFYLAWAGCMIILLKGCLTYFLAPIVLGLILAAVLPLVGLQLAWWKGALLFFLVRLVIRYFAGK